MIFFERLEYGQTQNSHGGTVCSCSGLNCISQKGKCQWSSGDREGNGEAAQSERRRGGWNGKCEATQSRIVAGCVDGSGRDAKTPSEAPSGLNPSQKTRNALRCASYRWRFSTTNSKSPNWFRAFLRSSAAPVLAGLRGLASRASLLPFPCFWPFTASLFPFISGCLASVREVTSCIDAGFGATSCG